MAETLAGEFHSMDNLAAASRERLMEISAVGPRIADSFTAFFRRTLILISRRLKTAGDENGGRYHHYRQQSAPGGQNSSSRAAGIIFPDGS
jgi:NAD-dependent DNA ligase